MLRVWLEDEAQIAFPLWRVREIVRANGHGPVVTTVNDKNRITATRERKISAVGAVKPHKRNATVGTDRNASVAGKRSRSVPKVKSGMNIPVLTVIPTFAQVVTPAPPFGSLLGGSTEEPSLTKKTTATARRSVSGNERESPTRGGKVAPEPKAGKRIQAVVTRRNDQP